MMTTDEMDAMIDQWHQRNGIAMTPNKEIERQRQRHNRGQPRPHYGPILVLPGDFVLNKKAPWHLHEARSMDDGVWRQEYIAVYESGTMPDEDFRLMGERIISNERYFVWYLARTNEYWAQEPFEIPTIKAETVAEQQKRFAKKFEMEKVVLVSDKEERLKQEMQKHQRDYQALTERQPSYIVETIGFIKEDIRKRNFHLALFWLPALAFSLVADIVMLGPRTWSWIRTPTQSLGPR